MIFVWCILKSNYFDLFVDKINALKIEIESDLKHYMTNNQLRK
jgi:hypothetical protein